MVLRKKSVFGNIGETHSSRLEAVRKRITAAVRIIENHVVLALKGKGKVPRFHESCLDIFCVDAQNPTSGHILKVAFFNELAYKLAGNAKHVSSDGIRDGERGVELGRHSVALSCH